MPPPAAAPLDPTPRQLLAVVHNLAAGMGEASAAALANLPPDTVPRLRGTPHFDGLLAECRAFDVRPALERDAILQSLLRRAVERALADDRVGAITAALRLLGMLPQPRPAPPPRARRGRPGWLGDEDDDEAREAEFRGEPASGEAWGMEDDGEGGWLGPDGRPALPGREVDVIAAPKGPARLVDTAGLPGSLPAYIELLDGLDENRVGQHNRAAYPYGGPQWDPKTRTLWLWEGKGPRLSPSERERAREQGVPLDDEEEGPIAPDAPPSYSLSRREVGEGRGEGAGTGGRDACHPHPDPLPRPREREHEGASAANPPTTTPAPRAPHPPSPAAELRARLDLLLAGTAPVAPADVDLAEAVCALRWPKWPDYRGDLDLNAVRLALAGRSLDGRALARLGGAETGVAATTVPAAATSTPATDPATRHARLKPAVQPGRRDRLPDAWPACRAALTPPEPADSS